MSTTRNSDTAAAHTISPPPDEQHGGELVPVSGNYAVAPCGSRLGSSPGPLSARNAFGGPGPHVDAAGLSRWPLATGVGILLALGAMAAAWFLIPQKGEVIAYVQVQRDPETMTSGAAGRTRTSSYVSPDGDRNDEEQAAVDAPSAIRRLLNCR